MTAFFGMEAATAADRSAALHSLHRAALLAAFLFWTNLVGLVKGNYD